MIRSLNQGANALLESPTGSGKSLALLCSSLAWVAQQRGETTSPLSLSTELFFLSLSTGEDVKAACAPCGCVCHSNAVPTPCQNGIKTEFSVPTPCRNGIKTELSAGTSCQNGIKTESEPYENGIKTEASFVTQNGTEPCNESSMQPYIPILPADSLVGGAKGVADTTVTVGGAKGVAGPSCEAELDEDFRRPKKRYRTPGGVANSVSVAPYYVCTYLCEYGGVQQVSKKSCVYLAGPSSWRIEVEAKTVPASQQPSVMDTGLPTSPLPPTPTPAPLPCQLCACAKSAGLLGRYSSPVIMPPQE